MLAPNARIVAPAKAQRPMASGFSSANKGARIVITLENKLQIPKTVESTSEGKRVTLPKYATLKA